MTVESVAFLWPVAQKLFYSIWKTSIRHWDVTASSFTSALFTNNSPTPVHRPMGTWCSRSESFRWWKAFTQNLSTIVDAVKDKFWIFSGCKKVQTYSSEGRNWNYRIVLYCVYSARIPRSWQACKKVTSPAELWIIKIFRDPPNKLQSSDRGLVQVRLQQSSCVGIYWQSTFAVV